MDSPPPSKPMVLFDGECGFCNRSMEKWNGGSESSSRDQDWCGFCPSALLFHLSSCSLLPCLLLGRSALDRLLTMCFLFFEGD